MPSFRDIRGESVTAASGDIVRQYDETLDAYLGARGATRRRADTLLAADADCVLSHVLDGYLHMLTTKRENTLEARRALTRAHNLAAAQPVTGREHAHVDALEAWSSGDMRGAVDRWGAILAGHPRDIMAVKVSQFVLSYLGESERMRDTVAAVLPAWDEHVPGYGFLLGCYAYGLEEAGDYPGAEQVARRAVDLNPSDIWAAHAIAHVNEMQGRVRDGLSWIASASEHWSGCNNFALHLRWHEALFHLDLEHFDRVLELYDRDVRRQPTDEYLDVANAVSLLWRLEQADIDVGDRWRELAERACYRVGDHSLVFVDLHYLLALAAQDSGAINQFLASCERFAAIGTGDEAAVMAGVGLPLARAVRAHRRGRYGEVVDESVPLRREFRRIGGSHAQRDVFDQLLIDSAVRGRRHDVATELIAERIARRPRNIWGWKQFAAVLTATAAPGAADALRTLDMLREA